MDYEFRIMLAEKELAHFRELQTIMRSHQQAHDDSISVIGTRLGRIEVNIEKVSEMQIELSAAQLVTEHKMQNLIDAMAREHSNGKR